jgi:F-type H+-transporting ATPase subunit b
VLLGVLALKTAFVPGPSAPARLDVATSAAVALGTLATPAFAEEAAKVLVPEEVTEKAVEGKIELGGGFAINLDIPETNIVNIIALFAGLVYLLGPVLDESMTSRSKDIQQDIDDAVAKFDEAQTRLAEAQKAQSQAMEVVAEINGQIDKDKKEADIKLAQREKDLLAEQERLAESTIKSLQTIADAKVNAYIKEQSVLQAVPKLMNMSAKDKKKFTDALIDQI